MESFVIRNAVDKDDEEFLTHFLKCGLSLDALYKLSIRGKKHNRTSIDSILTHCLCNNAVLCSALLIREKIDVNIPRSIHTTRNFAHYKSNAIHIATQSNLPNIVSLLIAYGADVNATSISPDVETAVHIAIRNEYCDILKILLIPGVDLSIPWNNREKMVELFDMDLSQDVRRILGEAWGPDMHKSYPKSIRIAIRTVLLCDIRNRWSLPRDIWLLIFRDTITMWPKTVIKPPPVRKSWVVNVGTRVKI
jgi:ankyrin repeat protein